MRKSMDQAAEVWRSGQRESCPRNSRTQPLADVAGDEDMSGSLVVIAIGPTNGFDKVQRGRRGKPPFGFTLGDDEEFSDIE